MPDEQASNPRGIASDGALELIAKIVQVNSDNLSDLNARILEGRTRERDDMAEAFAMLHDRINSIPKTMMTVAVYNMLHDADHARDVAAHYLGEDGN